MKPLVLALAVVLSLATAPAFADSVPISLVVTVDEETTVFEDLEGTVDENGLFRGGGELEGDQFEAEWDFRGDLDPALTISLGVTDVDGPSVFSFLFVLPTGPLPPPSATGGSIGGSITDGNGDGATLSDNGQPIYTALVNGSPFQTMLNNPFSVTAADPFTTVGIPIQSFGLPGLTQPGPNVIVNDMGILITFALTGGNDSAAITANFVLEPFIIPEPASLTLMGVGIAGFAGRTLLRRMKRR